MVTVLTFAGHIFVDQHPFFFFNAETVELDQFSVVEFSN